MRTLSSVILAAIALGILGACAAERLIDVGDAMASARAADREPLKLADAAGAEAEPAKNPASEQPGLPAGHPPVGPAPAPGQGGLPPGHPPMPGPGGAPGQGGLPSGHPDISSGGAAPGGTVAPGPVRNGVVEIKALQGTKGGPPVGADPVLVEFYDAQGKVVGKKEAKLDAKGEVAVGEISFGGPVQPLITVTHQGVEYRAIGSVLTSRQNIQQVEMTVYEATEQEPAWVVKMRHVILANAPAGVQVTEMVSLHNPTDRAWIGAKSGEGKPVTLRLPLTAGAKDVQFTGGFHDCCTKFVEGAIVYEMPLTPGDTQFQFTYRVPANAEGSAKIDLVAPAATQHLMVFVPDDGSTFTSDSFRKLDPKKGTNLRANSRFYVADPQKPKTSVGFTIGGLEGVKPGQAEAPAGEVGVGMVVADSAAAGVPGVAKIVGGIGAGVILVVGVVVVFLKAPRTQNETSKEMAK